MPPSQVTGREPRTVTTYTYDDHGRLTQAITVSEPRWTETDYAAAVAYLQIQADTHDCGHLLSETSDPANEGAYEVDLPTRCHACDAKIAAQEAAEAKGGHLRPEALVWEVHLRTATSHPGPPR